MKLGIQMERREKKGSRWRAGFVNQTKNERCFSLSFFQTLVFENGHH